MPQRTRLLSAALGAMVVAFAGSAHAGDAAARRIIGFSPDGAYFAFEQYGTLDWSESHSGWSEIDIIDTQTDQFIGGKPIYVADESGASELPLKQARARAAAQAAPLLAKYRIAARGQRTASDKFTFPDEMIAYGDIYRVEQASQKWLGPTFDGLGISTIQLDQILADSTTDCSSSFDQAQPGDKTDDKTSDKVADKAGDKTGKALGFRLTLQWQGEKPAGILHEDKAVPASRKCPTSYSLSESYAFTPEGKPPAIAVLVQRFSQGWEGRDRRFIAVTGRIR